MASCCSTVFHLDTPKEAMEAFNEYVWPSANWFYASRIALAAKVSRSAMCQKVYCSRHKRKKTLTIAGEASALSIFNE